MLNGLACRQYFFKCGDAIFVFLVLYAEHLDAARAVFQALLATHTRCTQLLYKLSAGMELRGTLHIVREYLNALRFLGALRLLLLRSLTSLLCRMKLFLCSLDLCLCCPLFVCPTFFQSCCLDCHVLFVENGVSTFGTFQANTKILHRISLRFFLCKALLCCRQIL